MAFAKFDKADNQEDSYNTLMCAAHGCPQRWSVDAGKGRLCSRHAWVPANTWGEVTRSMTSESAFGVKEAAQAAEATRFEIVRKAYDKAPDHFKAWAYALRAREESGERLSLYQKACWREALGVRDDA